MIPAPRGRILDRNGNVLVDNTPTKVVAIDRQKLADVSDSDAVLCRIAALLNRYEKPKERFTLAVASSDTLAHNRVGPVRPGSAGARGLRRPAGVPDRAPGRVPRCGGRDPAPSPVPLREPRGAGARLRRTDLRRHVAEEQGRCRPVPEGRPVGRAGVEQSFEKDLRGTDGKRVVEVRPNGEIVRTAAVTQPRPGSDVYLTLNIDAQALAEQSIATVVDPGAHDRRPAHRPLPAGTRGFGDPARPEQRPGAHDGVEPHLRPRGVRPPRSATPSGPG